jgi:hypothetical protein
LQSSTEFQMLESEVRSLTYEIGSDDLESWRPRGSTAGPAPYSLVTNDGPSLEVLHSDSSRSQRNMGF